MHVIFKLILITILFTSCSNQPSELSAILSDDTIVKIHSDCVPDNLHSKEQLINLRTNTTTGNYPLTQVNFNSIYVNAMILMLNSLGAPENAGGFLFDKKSDGELTLADKISEENKKRVTEMIKDKSVDAQFGFVFHPVKTTDNTEFVVQQLAVIPQDVINGEITKGLLFSKSHPYRISYMINGQLKMSYLNLQELEAIVDSMYYPSNLRVSFFRKDFLREN